MSSITIATLPRISREALASRLRSLQQPLDSSPIAIVDVRDSDYIGGHIKGCINVPSNQLDYRTAELVRILENKETVVFHCALSQQRGPAAALRYLRERERLSGASSTSLLAHSSESEVKPKHSEEADTNKAQQVFVLEGGFVQWQERYGSDSHLTEGWQKDIWEFGY